MKALLAVVITLSFFFPMSAQGWQAAPQSSSPSAPASAPTQAAGQPESRLGMDAPVRAEEVFKNIDIFQGKPAAQVLPAMNAIRGNLGVSCTYCHTQYEWDKNDKPPKETTRKMFKMMGYIEDKYFDHKNKVTCWTCHRGHPEQPRPTEKPPEQAEQYIHLRQSLGVKCSHCHVQNQWEKDDVEAKKTARKMLVMVTDVIHQYYGKGGPIGCFGCHGGKVKPENGMEASPVQKAP